MIHKNARVVIIWFKMRVNVCFHLWWQTAKAKRSVMVKKFIFGQCINVNCLYTKQFRTVFYRGNDKTAENLLTEPLNFGMFFTISRIDREI